MLSETSLIMPTNQTSISSLPIYPAKVSAEDEKVPTKKKQIVGASAMAFVSGIKTKYNDTVTAIKDFERYATSTEGKIKFGVMFAGLLGGCVLSYKSPSKRLWYKRMLPVGTLSLAASVCYPYKAMAVAKSTSHAVVTTYSVSTIFVTYCYGKLQKLKTQVNDANAAKVSEANEELEYTVNKHGILAPKKNAEQKTTQQQLEEISEHEESSPKQTNNTTAERNSKPTDLSVSDILKKDNITVLLSSGTPTTDLYAALSDPKNTEKSFDSKELIIGDEGQGSPEDADLYTTR